MTGNSNEDALKRKLISVNRKIVTRRKRQDDLIVETIWLKAEQRTIEDKLKGYNK